MLGEGVRASTLPLRLRQTDLLRPLGIHVAQLFARHQVHGHITPNHTLELDLEILRLVYVHHGQIRKAILPQTSAHVQPRGAALAQAALQPRRVGLAAVGRAPHVRRHRPPAHVAAEEQQRPPRRLAHHAGRRRHQGADHVHRLRYVRHPDPPALAHEDVEPDGHGQRVAQRVRLLGPFITGCSLRVPHVPLVEADLGGGARERRRRARGRQGGGGGGRRGVALDARQVDQRPRDLDGALGGQGGRGVLDVRAVRRVDVDAVEVDPVDALAQDVVVPGAVARLAAEHEDEVRVEQPERLGPLRRLAPVLLLRRLLHLPGPPHLVPQRPVLDAVGRRVAVRPPPVRPVRVPRAVAVLDPRERLVQRPRPHVQAEVRLYALGLALAQHVQPRHELVRPERVGLRPEPGQLRARGPLRPRPDPVRPVVRRAEVAPRVPHHGDVELPQRREHVPPEPCLRVRGRVPRLVEPAVDAAAHVPLDIFRLVLVLFSVFFFFGYAFAEGAYIVVLKIGTQGGRELTQ